MHESRTRTLAIAGVASLFAAAVWVALAWRTPNSTFHFAPIVAAAVGPYLAKSRAGRLPFRAAVTVSGVSTAMVGLAIIVLVVGDRLQGPTFWSEDGAALEALLFTAIGAVAGFALLAGNRAREV